MWYIHTVEFHSSIKMSEIASFAGRRSIEGTETLILSLCFLMVSLLYGFQIEKSIGLGSSLVVKSHTHAHTRESRWGSYRGQNGQVNGGD